MNKFFKLVYISFFIFALVSCEEFLEGTNVNPNDPTSVSPQALLTPVQLTLAYEYNANFSRWSGIFVQQVEGVARQQAGFNNYTFAGSNFETDWSNLYVDVLQNLNIMIANSSEAGYNHYVGIGQALKAYTLMLMTDYWNHIPNSEAYQGIDNLQPIYDSQADIYAEVHSLLNQARQSLNSSDGGLSVSGDIIYSGSTAAWIKATHAIQARAYLHQSLTNNSYYTQALSSIDQAFSSEADDMEFKFGNSATTAAPWYQFNRDRGDIGFNSSYGDALGNYNDPRLDIYDGDGSSLFGDVVDTHEFFVIDQGVKLVGYTELLFAKAECLIATGGSQADISAAYLEGIKSSFAELGLSDSDYSTYIAQANVSPSTIGLTEVMTQKWFALYANPESFTDWRRTNIPSLTPNNGVAIPTRWLYPQSETELNPNTPNALLTDKVDWDTN